MCSKTSNNFYRPTVRVATINYKENGMAQFKSFSADAEINGETISSIVNGMGVFRGSALKELEKHGIVEPQPGNWYNKQAWLNALKTIANTVGPATVFAIGLKVPETAKFPPDIDSLSKALQSLDVAYHMNHRNGEIGHYEFKRTGERSVSIVCSNPYPCDFDRGLLSAFCKRFKPKGSNSYARVTHDDSNPCRKNGGDSCTYLITW
jgi:hypothetical protein